MTAVQQVEPTLQTVTPGDVIDGYVLDLQPGGPYPYHYDAGATSPEWLRLPDGRQALPHTVLFEVGNRTFSTRYLSGRKLNASVRHVFHAPVVPPVRVLGSVEILATYIRRGREHVEYVARAHDAEGRLLLESHNNWVMNSAVRHEVDQLPQQVAAPSPASWRPTLPVSDRARSIAPGTELPALRLRSVLNDPEGGHEEDSVHSEEYARRVMGFRGAITLGSTNLGYVDELLGREFGPSWLERGSFDVRFIASVVRDDVVVARAQVRDRVASPDGDRLELDVTVTNETADGQTAVVGTAAYRL